jgi:hypothetical protein
MRLLFLLLLASAWTSAQSNPRGVVRDANGGEPLARVRLVLTCAGHATEQLSSADGRFAFTDAAQPGCGLHVTLVGYRPLRLDPIPGSELELVLTPDNLARRESIDVSAGPFELTQTASPSERTLSGAEMKNLAGVIADDPLRAVQALPGVASSNDYVAQFSVRAASFNRIGIFLDGILLHSPFHTVQSQEETGSLSIVQTDVIEELTLHAGAPPVAYQDRSAAALDIRLREGSRQAPAIRVNAGVASSSLLAEGPLGRQSKGSWLAIVRKSYLQYLLRRASSNDTLAFGFFDVQGKLAYDLNSSNSFTLGFLDGKSDLDRSHVKDRLGINAIMDAGYHVSTLNLGWRYAPVSNLMLTNRVAWMRERSNNGNPLELPLAAEGYGEWVWNSSLLWNWGSRTPLQAGFSFRRLRDDGFSARYNFNPLAIRRRDNWRGTALRAGGYLEQAWTAGPLTLTAGARFDTYSESGPAAVSPHFSALWRLLPGTRLQLAVSQAVQYPALLPLLIENIGNPRLLPERSQHAIAAVEQYFGERTRLRAEFFYRADRDLIAQPLLDPRLLPGGAIFVPPAAARYENSVRGAARGFELFLHRRTANRLSGFISYGYARQILRDGITQARYPADTEQRHTVSVYSSYRLRPTVNLSARYSYGSNFPVPGFFQLQGSTYYLSANRNQLRLPAYHRADVRLNKSFHHTTAQGWNWRGVLFVEVANLTNHDNLTFDSFNGFNSRTGQASPAFLKLFPIVPAAGVMLEWDAPSKRRR